MLFAITQVIAFVAFVLMVLSAYAIFSKAFKGKSTSTQFFIGAIVLASIGVVCIVLKDYVAFFLLVAAISLFAMAIRWKVTKQE
ncbi:hypothetical protein [Alicyclobacillus pomorum]|jgi:hypothetical protein|uniref:hypothetical protein n=1 Tax=Alicyclobacillus pomorum TaxID=204470 RepID=UPI00042331FC|nr:hypothetical protein [Alicyclobacillus pomorum]